MLGQWVERLFSKHKFMRRSVMYWSMGIITYIVVERPDMATGSFVAIASIFATSIGLYQWDKIFGKDNGSE